MRGSYSRSPSPFARLIHLDTPYYPRQQFLIFGVMSPRLTTWTSCSVRYWQIGVWERIWLPHGKDTRKKEKKKRETGRAITWASMDSAQVPHHWLVSNRHNLEVVVFLSATTIFQVARACFTLRQRGIITRKGFQKQGLFGRTRRRTLVFFGPILSFLEENGSSRGIALDFLSYLSSFQLLQRDLLKFATEQTEREKQKLISWNQLSIDTSLDRFFY